MRPREFLGTVAIFLISCIYGFAAALGPPWVPVVGFFVGVACYWIAYRFVTTQETA